MSGGITLKAAGTPARSTLGTPITPTLPSRASGDMLLAFFSVYGSSSDLTSGTLAALAASNWLLCQDPTGTPPTIRGLRVYRRSATGDSGDSISADWTGTAGASDTAAFIDSYTGDVPADLTNVMLAYVERASTGTTGFPYGAVSITQANACAVAVGKRLKSNTVDSPGLTIGTLPNFTKVGDYVETGNFRQALTRSYWNQTTPTSISLQSQSSTPADSSLSDYGVILVFQSATSVASTPVIGDVDGDNTVTATQTGVVVHGIGFGASQGAGSVVISDGALTQNLTVSSWSDTAITVAMALGNLRYGQRTLTVTADSGFSDDQAFQLNLPVGKNYVDLIGPFVPTEQRLVSSPDFQSGWQIEWSNVTNGFSIGDVTVFEDAEWAATPGLYAFDARANDGVNGWGSAATQTLTIALPLITGNPTAQTVTEGQTARFSVTATGTIATYQWLRNGAAISGATSASYTTAATVLADSGAEFTCAIGNDGGTVTSDAAVLTVLASVTPPPVVVTTPPPAYGSDANILARLQKLLPAGWFPFGEEPIVDAVLSGFSSMFAYVFDLLGYAKLQTRIATATDVWLDLIAYDFFGTNVDRQAGQSDASFRNTIVAYLFRQRNTRNAIISAVEQLLGTTPVVFEPQRAADTGGYGVASSMGYGVAGRYGSMSMPLQCFVDVTIPDDLLIGPPNVAGWGDAAGGYGVGQIEWVGKPALDPIAVADVYAAIDAVLPVTGIAWTKINGAS